METATKVAVLGDWVHCTRHDYIGRVYAIHHECPESRSWIAGQEIPVTREHLNGRWVSILVDGGGSVVQPISTVEVLDEHPDRLVNTYADVYFREEA